MREPSIVRPIVLLSMASFASVATMRADPLLPQVAREFEVSAGEASVIATAFALAYGICQLVYGVLGDRFGKYRLVALMTVLMAIKAAVFDRAIVAAKMRSAPPARRSRRRPVHRAVRGRRGARPQLSTVRAGPCRVAS